MRELLRKYIIIMFAVGCAIMIFVNIALDFNIAKKQQEAIFQSIMHQIVDIIDNNEAEALSFELELEEDYIIRARALASILATIENSAIYQTKELVKLAAFLDIDEINIFNEEGYIVASTESNYIGYSINKTKQSQEFLPLLHSININEKYVQETQSNMYGKYMKYIGVNCLDYKKGFIQIGLAPERFSYYKEKNSMKSIFKRAALEQAKIMILDNKGEILGASENINKDFKRNSKLVFNIIKNGAADSIIEIQGNDYYTASMEYKDYMIIGAVDIKSLYQDIQWHILSIILCMILICILGIVLLDRVLDKNIICNIKEIISVINKIEKGDFNVRIEEKGCLELMQIESAINNMTNVLINMSNRLEKVVISTNLPLGLFEYMPNLKQILITNSVKEILSINEYEWEEVKNNSQLFKKFLLQIEQNPVQGEPNIYIFNNKFIKLNLILEEEAYFGFIEDVTTEMIKKDNMLNELKREQIKSKIDTLTGLLNKGAITNIITEYAYNNNKGTLILFDLDNFKKVNDTKGHPEGDRLLKIFSNTIKDLFNQEDYVARFGGDEFAIFICEDITEEYLAEKLQLVINKVREELKEYYENFHLSVSIGAGSLSDEIDSFEKLYELADRRLYVAKHNGKDNYCIK